MLTLYPARPPPSTVTSPPRSHQPTSTPYACLLYESLALCSSKHPTAFHRLASRSPVGHTASLISSAIYCLSRAPSCSPVSRALSLLSPPISHLPNPALQFVPTLGDLVLAATHALDCPRPPHRSPANRVASPRRCAVARRAVKDSWNRRPAITFLSSRYALNITYVSSGLRRADSRATALDAIVARAYHATATPPLPPDSPASDESVYAPPSRVGHDCSGLPRDPSSQARSLARVILLAFLAFKSTPPLANMPATLLQRRHYNTLASILKDGKNRRCKIDLHDLEVALVALGFTVVNAKGSKFMFTPPSSIGRVALRLHLHKHELGYYHQDALKRAMEELYGWGPGTFGCA
ncbi:hypothetical protein NUW54_g4363 [Trametes sanguinea]|uniref:Uncharacterized protein n=1 Tax=Trametes sanguinea TaxID=158606 RepID=A0ACC1Q0M9_9APHY|nr:hypothetical protein NUW54_g4363 [Trametes sanguinea]